ncbi:hypothetical protein [Sphingobacterium lumbrici]|uniref:hypothetical protein n=1 Tax=Sphingobacterium lumbrici TaxID=2559600 RepID=UPI001127C35C|nr:hypothetical protein [Sphingobacterium lumbrici]
MKKLLLGSIVLFLFSASGLMFQISCSKEVKAENTLLQNEGLKQLGKISYKSQGDYWLANYNGTGQQKLNIPLPSV